MPTSVETLVTLVFLTLVLASVYFWVQLAVGRVACLAPVRRGEPQAMAPWSLIDLAIVFVCLTGSLMVAQTWALRGIEVGLDFDVTKLAPDTRVRLVWSMAAGTWVGTLLGLGWIVRRYRVGAARLTGDLGRWREDLKIAGVAFVMLAPPVLVLQLVLTRLFPSEHPLIELVLQNPEPRFLWASGVSAVIVAPLMEEFQFRVLLQGWLQTVARRDVPSERWIFGLVPPATSSEGAESPSRTRDADEDRVPARWPMFVSALLFAAAHWSHGPDPIPLFFFALGLGWIYRGTGRVLPGILVHFLLNFWTLFVLLAKIYGE